MADSKESRLLNEITVQLRGIRALLLLADLEEVRTSPTAAFRLLWRLKAIQGNSSNSLSALACLAVNEYLVERFGEILWNPIAKAQGAAGRDVDLVLTTGERVIGEVKTTTPYKKNDFGANQKESIKVDILKLRRDAAAYKFFFVTDPLTYSILERGYKEVLGEVEVILLGAVDGNGLINHDVSAKGAGRWMELADFEVVEPGRISSIDRHAELISDLALANEAAGFGGLT